MRSNTPFQLCILGFFAARRVSGHAFILAIDGANGRRSTGFGARLTSRGTLVQNTGIILEKEIRTGEVTPCGRIFGGDGLTPSVVDVAQELAIAERDGVASAGQDGSVLMSLYAHNADGAGPYTCDYSSDTSLQEMKPMAISKQIEGDKGNNPHAKDFAYPLISVFPNDAICRGGRGGDTCVMRCINPLGFGSCAAVKLFGNADAPNSNAPNMNMASVNAANISPGNVNAANINVGNVDAANVNAANINPTQSGQMTMSRFDQQAIKRRAIKNRTKT